MNHPPPSPFGVPWEQLRLGDVRRFFGGKPVERTIWEAKQQDTKAKLKTFVRRESCGFTNRRGGYLVLGAEERDNGAWHLSGVEVAGVNELHDWVASILLQLEPPPVFDVHEWGLSNGRRLAIVQVSPALLPPVSVDGVVYIRHGTQTIKADGAAIRRLADEGRRTTAHVEKMTRRLAKGFAEQIWVPFGVAVGRPDERQYALADTEPQDVAYEELRRRLEGRWPKRELVRLERSDDGPDAFRDLPHRERPPRAPLDSWMAAWEVDQAPTQPYKSTQRRRFGSRPKRDLTIGDRDIWVAQLFPDNLAGGFLSLLPVRQMDMSTEYGERAISHAALLLRALLAMERALGAAQHDPLFVCLVLVDYWGRQGPVQIERWDSMTISPREWQQDVTKEAAKKMHLAPRAS